MIVRFKQVSPTLYTAEWNGRKITVDGPDGWGPWTLKVDGVTMPVNGKPTTTNPTEAFRVIELAAQNIVTARLRSGALQARQRTATV